MNIIKTVITAELPKPEMASSGLTRSKTSSSPRQVIATTSIGIHSRAKAVTAKTMMPMRRAISRLMRIPWSGARAGGSLPMRPLVLGTGRTLLAGPGVYPVPVEREGSRRAWRIVDAWSNRLFSCPLRARLASGLQHSGAAGGSGRGGSVDHRADALRVSQGHLGVADLQDEPRVMVHLESPSGQLLRTFDHPFPGGWEVGEERRYEIVVFQSALGPVLEAGDYGLAVGLYDLSGHRWPVATKGDREAATVRSIARPR